MRLWQLQFCALALVALAVVGARWLESAPAQSSVRAQCAKTQDAGERKACGEIGL